MLEKLLSCLRVASLPIAVFLAPGCSDAEFAQEPTIAPTDQSAGERAQSPRSSSSPAAASSVERGPEEEINNGPCRAGMVFHPSGLVARSQESKPEDERADPEASESVEAFCIDRFEFPNQRGTIPKNQVTWPQANKACKDAGKRLCTALEWRRACRGTEGRPFSYGREMELSTCNTPITDGGETTEFAPVAASGSHPDCRSPEGVHDLNGNLSEWVADPWPKDRLGPVEQVRFPRDLEALKKAGKEPPEAHMILGGTMWQGGVYGQSCLSTHGHYDGVHARDDGFRCCSDP